MTVYATEQALEDYRGGTATPNADRKLLMASSLVRRATMLAIYRTVSPTGGLPLDARLAEAMSNATCEQVVAWDDAGIDPTTEGVVAPSTKVVASKSMGGRSESYDNSASTTAAVNRAALLTGLTPIAYQYLVDAGLTRRQPYVI